MASEVAHAAHPQVRVIRRALHRTALASCLAALVVTCVVIGVVQLSAGASQSNPAHTGPSQWEGSCRGTHTTAIADHNGAPCDVPTTNCTGSTTTSTIAMLDVESTTMPSTTTTTEAPAPTTSTTGVATTTTAAPTTTSAPETTTTAVPTTTSTTVPTVDVGGINVQGDVVPPTSAPESIALGGGVEILAAAPAAVIAPVSANLPRTGSDLAVPLIFASSCLAGGALLLLRRRRAWSSQT